MIKFSDWVLQKESSPATRARAAAANGLLPLATVGSIHGHSTASPWQVEKLTKKSHKSKKKIKFGATLNKKKVTPTNKNVQIDAWIKGTDDLKSDLMKLKAVFDKKKVDAYKKVEKKDKSSSDKNKEDLNKKDKPSSDKLVDKTKEELDKKTIDKSKNSKETVEKSVKKKEENKPKIGK